MDVKFFKCMHCGNVAIKPFDQGVPMSCCGEKMVELRANAPMVPRRSTCRRSSSTAPRFT